MQDDRQSLRVALYSHDTMGLGHVRRNLLIAQALANRPAETTVLVVAGVPEACGFDLPCGVDLLTLPAFSKRANRQYRSRQLRLPAAALVELRSRILQSCLESFAPDVLIVDTVPRGVYGELDQTLAALRTAGRTRLVLGLRDVLDTPSTIVEEWKTAENERAIREFYDIVFVYGDPTVYDPIDEYGLSAAVAAKVLFTGYLDQQLRLDPWGCSPPAPEPQLPTQPYIFCTLGGGQDGEHLARAFVAAALPAGRTGVLLTGPHLPNPLYHELESLARARGNLRLLRFVPEAGAWIRGAERVIAMGGYNTVGAVLACNSRALIVPRVQPRREQFIRARRFAQLGLVDMLIPDRLCPASLSRWLAAEAQQPADRWQIDLGGLDRVVEAVESLLPQAKVLRPHTSKVKTYSSPCSDGV